MTEHHPPALLKFCRRIRKIVETVGSHLTERFRVDSIRVHDLWHFQHRLIRKVLSHTRFAYAYATAAAVERPPDDGQSVGGDLERGLLRQLPDGQAAVRLCLSPRPRHDSGAINTDWRTYRVSVDQVEALTGFDFFSNVADPAENFIEAIVDNQ
jgi:hypothetical protein